MDASTRFQKWQDFPQQVAPAGSWSVSAAELHHKTSQNLREIGPSVHDGGPSANGEAGCVVLTNENVCLVACAVQCRAPDGTGAGRVVAPGGTYHQSWIITWTRSQAPGDWRQYRSSLTSQTS